MKSSDLFVIDYQYEGAKKTFVIRTPRMRNTDAWHWACCDAGLAPIPKPGRPPLKTFTKPLAERHGVTNVTWRESTPLVWTHTHSD